MLTFCSLLLSAVVATARPQPLPLPQGQPTELAPSVTVADFGGSSPPCLPRPPGLTPHLKSIRAHVAAASTKRVTGQATKVETDSGRVVTRIINQTVTTGRYRSSTKRYVFYSSFSSLSPSITLHHRNQLMPPVRHCSKARSRVSSSASSSRSSSSSSSPSSSTNGEKERPTTSAGKTRSRETRSRRRSSMRMMVSSLSRSNSNSQCRTSPDKWDSRASPPIRARVQRPAILSKPSKTPPSETFLPALLREWAGRTGTRMQRQARCSGCDHATTRFDDVTRYAMC